MAQLRQPTVIITITTTTDVFVLPCGATHTHSYLIEKFYGTHQGGQKECTQIIYIRMLSVIQFNYSKRRVFKTENTFPVIFKLT